MYVKSDSHLSYCYFLSWSTILRLRINNADS